MKPDWKDAPGWARWLAQDRNGYWYWYAERPVIDEEEDRWDLEKTEIPRKVIYAQLAGDTRMKKWRESLEARP